MGKRPDRKEVQERLAKEAEALQVPGVALGIYHGGEETYAFHGVTSVEHPLPVDENTLFEFGSTGKTFTATVIMRLVEQGKVDLHEKVRTYIPELKLKDEDVAREVTVLHLLNHTGGWQGDFQVDTGAGDDALAKYIGLLDGIEQEYPLGKIASYNNAGFSLAGRVIENVTGMTYEKAIDELLLKPLGMEHTFFFANDVMTRRFAVGHLNHPDGSLTIESPWGDMRSGNPMGGMSANAADQVAWIRFHLGDGKGVDGSQVLSRDSLAMMREPTAKADGAALGDHVGIAWMLQDIEGVRTAKHGGSINGQQSAFHLVPEHDFGITVLTNASPNGIELHTNVVRWALESYLGLVDRIPDPVPRSAEDLTEYTGRYERIELYGDISIDGNGLVIVVEMKEADEDEDEDELPPFPVGMLAERDRFIVTDGPFKTMKGTFVRDEAGAVEAIHLGGRLMFKTRS